MARITPEDDDELASAAVVAEFLIHAPTFPLRPAVAVSVLGRRSFRGASGTTRRGDRGVDAVHRGVLALVRRRRYGPVVPAGPSRRSPDRPPTVAANRNTCSMRRGSLGRHSTMPDFRLVAPFQPTGDQPVAIDRLVDGLADGLQHQTLLGATGTGKTFTIASDDRDAQQADARAGPQQDAGRPAVRRVPRVLPGQRGRVLRQLLRLLPARGLPAAERHVHREGLVAGTTRSIGSGTPRRTRCSSGAT